MECEHPLRFWAVYRALMSGSQWRGFHYRCPACRRKLILRVPRANVVLTLAINAVSVTLGTLAMHALGIIERFGLLLAFVFTVLPALVLAFGLFALVCWIELRFRFYKLDGYA